jgi:predicted choloylglycine hydrolase
MDSMNPIPVPTHILLRHAVLEGTSYDVGKMQGHMLKEDPEQYRFITSLPPGMTHKKYSKDEFRKVKDFFAKYCPGINEEIKGTADVLGVCEKDITYYYIARSRAQHCSHFAILPSISNNGHMYAGHNYDLHPALSDLRLCTTRVKNHYSHIGFSEDFFGRTEGINEKGLCRLKAKCFETLHERREKTIFIYDFGMVEMDAISTLSKSVIPGIDEGCCRRYKKIFKDGELLISW